MPRQRLRVDFSTLSQILARVFVAAVALALVYGGLVVLLLALGVGSADVERISRYRAAYDALTGIMASDITGEVRLVAAIVGLVAFAVFGLLAWRGLPRPYLARSDTRLSDDVRGYVNVSPRALERAAEGAALGVPAVTGARGRHDADRVSLEITARGAADVPATLAAVRERARDSLRTHGLPEMPIDCTLTALERKNRRELA